MSFRTLAIAASVPALVFGALSLPGAAHAAAPLPGAVFTSAIGCIGVDLNIYAAKGDVYLNGGPAHPGAAGLLPNTSYYVQVTDPSGGTVLGSSLNNLAPLSQKPLTTNALGNFTSCSQLAAIVALPGGTPGYADTPNAGGEYKVHVSTVADFSSNSTKTDNFKVRPLLPPPPDIGKVTIIKWYDVNANGIRDPGELDLTGWKVDLAGEAPKNTVATYADLALTSYTAEEFTPLQLNWYPTNAFVDVQAQNPVVSTPTYLNKIGFDLTTTAADRTVYFGNVCTGAGNGLTLGFWSNKNGQDAIMKSGLATALGALTGLNLKSAGTKTAPLADNNFDPADYAAFKSWLLSGNAVNMAYMLSVQLATMKLNTTVPVGNPAKTVSISALVYAPGVDGANEAGFMTIATLMDKANTALGTNGYTWAGVPTRSAQEYLKTALDMANNNRTFVQSAPCPVAFANPVTP